MEEHWNPLHGSLERKRRLLAEDHTQHPSGTTERVTLNSQ